MTAIYGDIKQSIHCYQIETLEKTDKMPKMHRPMRVYYRYRDGGQKHQEYADIIFIKNYHWNYFTKKIISLSNPSDYDAVRYLLTDAEPWLFDMAMSEKKYFIHPDNLAEWI